MIRKNIYVLFIIFLFLINPTIINANNDYIKAPIDINEITITEIQDAMNKGYINSELLTKLYLERIETYNDQYEAIISINPNALEIASNLDQERKEQGPRSILHGIPIIIKDNYDLIGLPTTGGAKALWDSYPIKNAFIVQKLIDSGAIILAKANMSTFAFSGSSSTSSFLDTKNAYNINYSSYGSSGGTAVAISANLATVGLGTDTNSSIRGPASANGLVGLRPTLGLVSRTGILPYTIERDTGGPMTRTISDLAILLDFIVGYDENDSITENIRNKIPDSYTNYLNTDGLKNKNIGIINGFIESNPNSSISVLNKADDNMKNLIEIAIEDMENKGANIIYIDNFYTNELHNLYNNTLDGFTFCDDLNNYLTDLSPNNRIKNFNDLMNDGRYIYSISDYSKHCNNSRDSYFYKTTLPQNKEEYTNYVLNIMENYNIDAFAYPTFKTKINTIENKNIDSGSTSHSISPTTGFPSITVPMGYDNDGLPYGLQFAAKSFEEGKLIEIAYAYEQATKHRISPTIAPSLYSVSNNTFTLINKIENAFNIDITKYTIESIDSLIQSIKNAKNFLGNYNDTEDNIDNLLLDLNTSINNLELKKENIKYEITNYHIIITNIIIIIGIIFFIIYKKKKKH